MSHWKHQVVGVNWAALPLSQRELVFDYAVKRVGGSFDQPPFAIMWEDPDDLDGGVHFTVPTPVWWAMALHGDILPPVEVYWALADDEAKPGFKRHTRGRLLHETPAVPAMNPREAMHYLVMKDIPPRAWRDYAGNRSIMKIIPRKLIPTRREYRDAWRIAQDRHEREFA